MHRSYPLNVQMIKHTKHFVYFLRRHIVISAENLKCRMSLTLSLLQLFLYNKD